MPALVLRGEDPEQLVAYAKSIRSKVSRGRYMRIFTLKEGPKRYRVVVDFRDPELVRDLARAFTNVPPGVDVSIDFTFKPEQILPPKEERAGKRVPTAPWSETNRPRTVMDYCARLGMEIHDLVFKLGDSNYKRQDKVLEKLLRDVEVAAKICGFFEGHRREYLTFKNATEVYLTSFKRCVGLLDSNDRERPFTPDMIPKLESCFAEKQPKLKELRVRLHKKIMDSMPEEVKLLIGGRL